MNSRKKISGYVPGFYPKKGPTASVLAAQYIQEWEMRRIERSKKKPSPITLPPSICISRKVGIGVVQIADLAAKRLDGPLIDRQILEHIAETGDLSKKTISYFDKHYPGEINELAKLLTGEKSFIMSDYIRHLISAVYSLAETGPAIFVGRGCHLILPRDKVLAVRLIGSMSYRATRLADLMKIDEKDAKRQLLEFDKEQREFFRKLHGEKDAPADEFDIVINLDYFAKPQSIADVIVSAYQNKFSDQ